MAKNELNCANIQKNIPKFINRQMKDDEIMAFTEHVRNCPECYEELSIEYLVVVDMNKLDDVDGFNLDNELNRLIDKSRERVENRKRMFGLKVFLAFVLTMFAAYVIAYLIFW